MRRSAAWNDIQEVVQIAAARKFQRVVLAIKGVADIPVLQEWSGWGLPYEASVPGLDGIAMRSAGASPSAVALAVGRAASSVSRWRKPGWLVASDVDLPDAAADFRIEDLLEDLTAMGTRAWFFSTPNENVLRQLVAAGDSRDPALAQYTFRPLFFPENATHPAVAQRLPSGHVWLPAPSPGNRIDLGSRYLAYRIQDGQSDSVVLWSADGERRRVVLRMAEPRKATFRTLDGSDPEPKVSRNGVQVWISPIPLMVSCGEEIPVPEPAFAETVQRFDQLLARAEAEQREVTEERFFFKDALNGFDRNPGGSFATMRAQYLRLSSKVSPSTWIEAETARNHSFGESLPVPGCSGGSVLALRSLLKIPGQVHVAEFTVPVRSPSEQEVWIAARIGADQARRLRLVVDQAVLTMESQPTGFYGAGFAWYRLGTIALQGRQKSVRLEIEASDGVDLAVDVVLFHPGSFEPSGIRPPDAIPFAIPAPDRR
jgi:hypothetical protein